MLLICNEFLVYLINLFSKEVLRLCATRNWTKGLADSNQLLKTSFRLGLKKENLRAIRIWAEGETQKEDQRSAQRRREQDANSTQVSHSPKKRTMTPSLATSSAAPADSFSDVNLAPPKRAAAPPRKSARSSATASDVPSDQGVFSTNMKFEYQLILEQI